MEVVADQFLEGEVFVAHDSRLSVLDCQDHRRVLKNLTCRNKFWKAISSCSIDQFQRMAGAKSTLRDLTVMSDIFYGMPDSPKKDELVYLLMRLKGLMETLKDKKGDIGCDGSFLENFRLVLRNIFMSVNTRDRYLTGSPQYPDIPVGRKSSHRSYGGEHAQSHPPPQPRPSDSESVRRLPYRPQHYSVHPSQVYSPPPSLLGFSSQHPSFGQASLQGFPSEPQNFGVRPPPSHQAPPNTYGSGSLQRFPSQPQHFGGVRPPTRHQLPSQDFSVPPPILLPQGQGSNASLNLGQGSSTSLHQGRGSKPAYTKVKVRTLV